MGGRGWSCQSGLSRLYYTMKFISTHLTPTDSDETAYCVAHLMGQESVGYHIENDQFAFVPYLSFIHSSYRVNYHFLDIGGK